ncbi:MAG: hypothetical protein K8T89_01810, partial [Planctomycetes bacterium]|nr:hypothetical protein [Planctomycetota bacterium]
MNYRGGVVTGILSTLLVVTAGGLGWWFFVHKAPEPTRSSPPPIPAVVAKEDQFNTITLTDEAIKSLAIDTVPVVKKAMPRSRIYGGDVTIPPGRTIIVSAPFSGLLQALGKEMPLAG